MKYTQSQIINNQIGGGRKIAPAVKSNSDDCWLNQQASGAVLDTEDD